MMPEDMSLTVEEVLRRARRDASEAKEARERTAEVLNEERTRFSEIHSESARRIAELEAEVEALHGRLDVLLGPTTADLEARAKMSEHIDCECDSCATVPRAWLLARVEQLLEEVNVLRARLSNFEDHNISDRQREIDDRAMRIVEDVASRSIGIESGEHAYRRAAHMVREAIYEREAQRAKREGTGE